MSGESGERRDESGERRMRIRSQEGWRRNGGGREKERVGKEDQKEEEEEEEDKDEEDGCCLWHYGISDRARNHARVNSQIRMRSLSGASAALLHLKTG